MQKWSFGKAIRELRKKAGWSQSDLSTKTGIGQPSLSAIENDTYKGVNADDVNRLCVAFGLPFGYFVHLISPGIAVPQEPESGSGLTLPLVGDVSGGPPLGDGFKREEVSVPDAAWGDGRYVLVADGDSMIDHGIAVGGWVVVQPTADAEDGDLVFVDLSGVFSIKKLRVRERAGATERVLQGSRASDPILARDDAGFKILGVVTYGLRKFK